MQRIKVIVFIVHIALIIIEITSFGVTLGFS